MKKSYGKGLATHIDPESCGAASVGALSYLERLRSISQGYFSRLYLLHKFLEQRQRIVLLPD